MDASREHTDISGTSSICSQTAKSRAHGAAGGRQSQGYHQLPQLPCTLFELHKNQADAEGLRHDLHVDEGRSPLQMCAVAVGMSTTAAYSSFHSPTIA